MKTKRKNLRERLVSSALRNGYTITVQKAYDWSSGAKGWDWSIVNSLGCWEEPDIKVGQNKSLTDIHLELTESDIIL